LAVAGIWLAAPFANADVHLNKLFTPHMVLQRDRPLPVWGQAAAGEQVTVTFADATQTATADASGKWMVVLPPQAASAEPRALEVKGTNVLKVDDVLVGDVFLGLGQSNMDYATFGTTDAGAVKAMPAEAFKNIRTLSVQQASADEPQANFGGWWVQATPQSVMGFSAVLTYFGIELRKQDPNVPIGLIRASVGATNLYCWLPNEVRDSDPSCEYLRGWWSRATRNWTAEAQEKRDAEIASYQQQVDQLKANKQPIPADMKKPGELMGPKWSRRPSALYNGMLAPLSPYAVRAMVWYQGEWDAKRDWTPVYHDSFVAFIDSLRKKWAPVPGAAETPDTCPLYLIQLPAREPNDGRYWPFFREVQDKLSRDVPNAHLIVTYDTNDPNDLHPHEKTPVGQRLAWAVAANEYKQNVPWRGPHMQSVAVESGAATVNFEPGDGTLRTTDGEPPKYFEIAGDDGVFHPATAELHDNQVRLTAADVTAPKFVRYAFIPAPVKPNLTNTASLPAEPFRTDSQPLP